MALVVLSSPERKMKSRSFAPKDPPPFLIFAFDEPMAPSLGSRALWGSSTVAASSTTAKGDAGCRCYPAAFTLTASEVWPHPSGLQTVSNRSRPHLTPSCQTSKTKTCCQNCRILKLNLIGEEPNLVTFWCHRKFHFKLACWEITPVEPVCGNSILYCTL